MGKLYRRFILVLAVLASNLLLPPPDVGAQMVCWTCDVCSDFHESSDCHDDGTCYSGPHFVLLSCCPRAQPGDFGWVQCSPRTGGRDVSFFCGRIPV